VKIARQQRIYGGNAGEPYDRWYHQPCDDISNLSIRSLEQLSDGVAHATFTYANDEDLFGATSERARSLAKTYDEYKGPEAKK
jgi:hypothetical protein